MAKITKKADKGTMKRVLSYIGRYKLLLPISIALALITVGATLYLPMLIGEVINLIDAESIDFSRIAELFAVGAVAIAVTAIAQWLMSTINNKISFNVVRDIRNDAFSKIQTLPLSYLDRQARGDIVARVINDADRFAEGLLLSFTQLFTGILTIIGTLIFMLIINPIVALVVVVLTPLSLFVAKYIGTHTHSMFTERSKCEANLTSAIEEYVGNQKLVKAFNFEQRAIKKFNNANDSLQKSSLKAIFFSSLVNPTTRFVNNIVYAAVALAGALIAIYTRDTAGGVLLLSLTVGELTSLLSYVNQYTKPFNEISGVITEFQGALACACRVFQLIDEASECPDEEGAIVLNDADGNVSLRDVSFSYTPDKSLIEGLNLSVTPGQRVAIVGPTGCGKTTLINLLMRFYDVNEGEITVEGEDIRRITRDSLRQSYGMVLQDTWLRHGTIKENIAMGKPTATDEEIVAAAKASHAHSFIKRLKNGYDTVIGEGGDELSEGQRQLICITRVMLALPPMLILDEATSSIDTRTEMKIQEAFMHLMHGRTTFIVAHRLSTIENADVILVMKDGRIVETGKHRELIERGGFYSTLWKSQFAH